MADAQVGRQNSLWKTELLVMVASVVANLVAWSAAGGGLLERAKAEVFWLAQ